MGYDSSTFGMTDCAIKVDDITVRTINAHPATHAGESKPVTSTFWHDGEACVSVQWYMRKDRAGVNALTEVGAIMTRTQAYALRAQLDIAIRDAERLEQDHAPAGSPKGPTTFETLYYTPAERAPETDREREERFVSDCVAADETTRRGPVNGGRLNPTDRSLAELMDSDRCEDCDGQIDTDGEVCRDCETQRAVETADHMADSARDGD